MLLTGCKAGIYVQSCHVQNNYTPLHMQTNVGGSHVPYSFDLKADLVVLISSLELNICETGCGSYEINLVDR